MNNDGNTQVSGVENMRIAILLTICFGIAGCEEHLNVRHACEGPCNFSVEEVGAMSWTQ